MNTTTEQPVQTQTPQVAAQEQGKPQEQPQAIQQQAYSVDVREIRTQFFDPVVWQQMKGMAEVFAKSGALSPEDNAAKVVMKIQAGYEMGMKPLEAVRSLYFVNGVLSIWGAAVTRRLREHGWRVQHRDEPNKCTTTIKRGDEEYTDSMTFEEAQKSGWTLDKYQKLKVGWREGQNRKLKLRYGAMSALIKTYVPEVLGSAAEIAEVAEDTVPLYENTGNAPGGAVDIPGSEHDDEPATDAQKKTILALAAKNGLTVEVETMTQKTAKAWIAGVNQK